MQIKATFKDSLTFRTPSEYHLGFHLYRDGHYDEIFNGPGRVIYDRHAGRKAIAVQLVRSNCACTRRGAAIGCLLPGPTRPAREAIVELAAPRR